MNVQEFLLPDLGEGLEDAMITTWEVAPGDTVELNQTLCTVETNKAQVEIPSPYAGVVVELGGEPGQTLQVGSVLARIAAADVRQPVLVGYGADEGMDVSRRAARPRAKPAVRKLAAQRHVDLAALSPGSGPGGIVTRDDVLTAAGALPVDAVQAAMAQRMTLSHSEIPDAMARVEVDGSGLLRLREHAGPDVTPFGLTLRMLVIALRHHLLLNSTWLDSGTGAGIHRHEAVHLGFGVATPRGLLVPVIRDAHTLTTRELAGCVTELAERARAGTLRPQELTGSTFTVSNYGALGLDDGIPVINYPESAILGMGSLKLRPVAVSGELGVTVTARPTMFLTCVFDHRIADGAQVAAFLCELRGLIEAPELALLDL